MTLVALGHDVDKAPQSFKYAKASAARSQGDVVYLGMDSSGWVDITRADDALVHHVAVADQSIASGDKGQYVVEGEVKITVPSGNYTAGHGLLILDGAIASTGAAFPAAAGVAGDAQTVFAAIKTGGTAVTEITVILHGKSFTATT